MTHKVLIVDDEASIRRVICRALRHQPYDLIEARDGIEALERIKSDVPDLILLDLAIPRLNGWNILRAIRTDLRTRTTPVIIVTGTGGKSGEIEGLDLGADDYIAKPFSVDELRARVGSILRRSRSDI